MGRPRGTRNADYENRRRKLAYRIFQCVLEDASTSLNAMADRTGVSRPTLRHYFGDRDGAIRAALEEAAKVGHPHVESLRIPSSADPVASLQDALTRIASSWRLHTVGNIHLVGLKIGLEDGQTGETYLSRILEPMLQAMEGLLANLIERGDLSEHDTRIGAITLISPLVVSLLHQDALGGGHLRPLDIGALIEVQASGYCRQLAPG